MDRSVEEKILTEAIVNAMEYGGSPNPKAVIGKLMGKYPELRKMAKTLVPTVEQVIRDNFPMGKEEMERRLSELSPTALQEREAVKKKQRERTEKKKGTLVELPNAEVGKVRVRLAPDPSKYPHIGHALNYTVNKMYAEKYEGKIILRFDDTNPAKVREEFYNAIKDGIQWAGIKWDEEYRASDFLDEFYEQAKEFMRSETFYVCRCTAEEIRNGRTEMRECSCRARSVEENLSLFEQMLTNKVDANSMVVRLRGDMSSDNSVMRDPVMLRLVEDKHPLKDRFYPVWPTYDFESPYLDWKLKITHIIRSGEFGSMRQELQSHIIKLLGGPVPEFFSYGRYNIKGCPLKGRTLRDLVDRGVVTGWDDIRLFTIEGWKRRGILPGILVDLIRENGTTPKTTTIDWSVVESYSKKLIEPLSLRLFFVRDPVEVEIADAPERDLSLPFHPSGEHGERKLSVRTRVLIDRSDASGLSAGDLIRLKDLFNIRITKLGETIAAEYAGDEIPKGRVPKIQWVGEEKVEGELLLPKLLEPKKNEIDEDSMARLQGVFEGAARDVDPTHYYQLERVGYAKLRFEDGKVTGHIVHLL